MGSVLLSGDAVAWLIKQLVARPRPTLPVLPASGYSFPSGHVFNAMLLALVVWQLLQHQLATGRLRVSLQGLVGLGVLLILIARVVLRAHYPSDTVASLLLATSWWVQWRVWWPFFVWGHHCISADLVNGVGNVKHESQRRAPLSPLLANRKRVIW
ncbi:phosphatase PAP2 family protein [Levilactobacillus zymae]|uniref:phosphatase PAP2 family protein n=1 Tax=Levilactobacillus zymae TaxID=267363 RepID=UPI001EE36108|nr:phosphatase PAP2 family protein [Levilactobacillus zymae]